MLILVILLLACAWGRDDVLAGINDLPGIKFRRLESRHTPTKVDATRATRKVQTLYGHRGSRVNSRSAAAVLGAHQRQFGGHGYQTITQVTAYGTQYATEILFGNQAMLVLVDTGSADSWVVQKDFVCLNASGDVVPRETCQFGTTYDGDFQYGRIPGVHAYIKYGDSELVTGPMGLTDITLSNMTVRKQQAALANSTYWLGNNLTSGILGLAFPSLTNAYLDAPDEHDPWNQDEYSPVFQSMVNQGLVPPVFSIALSRKNSSCDGVLAWGGVPPVPGMDAKTVAVCPIIITNLTPSQYHNAWFDYSFYTIIPDAFLWNSLSDTRRYPCIIDSGTTLIYLPDETAVAVNDAFKPPAKEFPEYDAFFTECNATAPHFAVTLNGTQFWLNPADLIYKDVIDPDSGLCMTAIAKGGSGPYILGDAFLQSVVTVFDIRAAQVRFHPREFY